MEVWGEEGDSQLEIQLKEIAFKRMDIALKLYGPGHSRPTCIQMYCT